jgi:N-ethylmaleimide reductase
MKEHELFTSFQLGPTKLKNRIVMSPLTRCRAIGNIPNDLMAEYYSQRAGAGLIITEGTSPSPNGLGYARIPGIFSEQQVRGWKKITTSVHDGNGKIFIQLMHTGRIGHILNLPKGARILAPSAVAATGQMWTDSKKMQDYPVPEAMKARDIASTVKEYADAAKYAMEAGFDGVELHGANGYLPEQFLSPISNLRTDNYGGNIENRCRFVLDAITAIAQTIGAERTGIRLSPYGIASGMAYYSEIDSEYAYLAEQLNHIGIEYIHIVDHSAMGAPIVPLELKKLIHRIFKKTIILSGGYFLERAEEDIRNGLGDLIAFGRPFINNPDLVDRLMKNHELSKNLNRDLFYTADEKGYTDYPVYKD